MKRIFALAILAVGLLSASCGKLENGIHMVEMKTDDVEDTAIATIQEQIQSIKSTIASLEKAKEAAQNEIESINGEIEQMQDNCSRHAAQIEELKKKLAAAEEAYSVLDGLVDDLAAHIDELETFEQNFESRVDDMIAANREWMEATFATIEQLQSAQDALSYLKAISDNASLFISERLAEVEEGIHNWVNSKLVDFVTLAEFQDYAAKFNLTKDEFQHTLDSLSHLCDSLFTRIQETERAIETGADGVRDSLAREKAAIEAEIAEDLQNIEDCKAALKAHQEGLDKLNDDLEKMRTEILQDCKSLAAESIEKFKGEISDTLKTKIDSLNNAKAPAFDKLNENISTVSASTQSIEDSLAELQGSIQAITDSINDICSRLDSLEGIIQSLTYVPGLNDNPRILEWGEHRESLKDGCPVLTFMVSPAAMADTLVLKSDNLTILAKHSWMTKAAIFDQPLTVQDISVTDAEQGIVSITIGTEAQLVNALKGGDLSLCIRYKDGRSNNVTSDFANLGTETPKRKISVKEVEEFGTLNLILPSDGSEVEYTIHPTADPEASASIFSYLSADPGIATIENATGYFEDLDEDQLEDLDELGLDWLSTPEAVIIPKKEGITPMFIKIPAFGTEYKENIFEFEVNVFQSKLRLICSADNLNPPSLFSTKPTTMSVTAQIKDGETWRSIKASDNVSLTYKIMSYDNILDAAIARLLSFIGQDRVLTDITSEMKENGTYFDQGSMTIRYAGAYRPALIPLDSYLTITASKQMSGYTDQASVTITLNSTSNF